MSEDRRAHWQGVYTAKAETDVSWFQDSPSPSLELFDLVKAGADTAVVDVGGGASRLVDALVARGIVDVTVLDLSAQALEVARKRLGAAAAGVGFIAADVTAWEPERRFAVWHDRAAFHFLTETGPQEAYISRLKRGLDPGGYAIIGTFAPDGPERCSGLPVQRHDAQSLAALLGPDFTLVDHRRHDHVTPWRSVQKFQFSTFRRTA